MNCTVLWIDDEHEKLKSFISRAEQKGIEINAYKSHENGMKELEKNLLLYDAVILDAKTLYKEEDEITNLKGLRASRDKLIEINQNIFLPFFILTGQPDYMNNEAFQELVGKFYIKGRDEDELFEVLKDIAKNKDEYRIRLQYKEALTACTERYLLNDYRNELMRMLSMLNEKGETINTDLYYKDIRILIEAIFRGANHYGMLPDVFLKNNMVNLSESSLFLSGRKPKYSDVSCITSHFTRIVSEIVKNIIHITGAAVHTEGEENTQKMQIQTHLKTTKTPYLFYSILYQMMDVLIWFKEYIDKNGDINKNKSFWIEKTDESINLNHHQVTGNIMKDKYGNYYCNNILLSKTLIQNDECVGSKVLIKKLIPNNNIKTKEIFPYFGQNFIIIQ
ncbi:MAG: hypothetical protein ACOCVN_01195 [bacterium]